MAIEVEENEARAKIEALAEKLGYSAVSFFPVQGKARIKGKYVLAFKDRDSQLYSWCMTLLNCKKGDYLGTSEYLLFEDNYWSHAVEKMEDAVKHRYSIMLQYEVVLDINETIDEALIRLDLNCLEK